MTRIEALTAAKTDGFRKAIFFPYTYHPRSIDSHLAEAERARKQCEEFSYPIDQSFIYDKEDCRIENTNGDGYLLLKI